MMRILILDDNKIILKDESPFNEYEMIQVIDEGEFWGHLYDGEWDEVWLDNDMGSNRPEGTYFAKAILEKFMVNEFKYKVKTFRSISNNGYAGNRIADDLALAGYDVIRCPVWLMEPMGVFRGELL